MKIAPLELPVNDVNVRKKRIGKELTKKNNCAMERSCVLSSPLLFSSSFFHFISSSNHS